MTAGSLLPAAPLPPGTVYAGKVARVFPVQVTIDAFGDTHEWPGGATAATWVSAAAPVRGQRALVLIDDAGGVWAVPAVVDSGATVEAWQSLAPYLGAGWTTGGAIATDWEHARFRRDRERVSFAGLVTYDAAHLLSTGNEQPIASMPAGYRPGWLTNVTVHTDPDSTRTAAPDTRNAFWTGDWLTTGRLLLDSNPTFSASPNFGACPRDTVLYLDDLAFWTT
jgi:hypothetical protein